MDKVTANIAETLAAQAPFVEAARTEVGSTLMSLWLNDANQILKKIIEEKASPQEIAEFRVLKRRINEMVEKINEYYKNLNKYKLKTEKSNE